MAGKGLNVFINIGAKIGPSVDASIRTTEAKLARMGRVVAAECRGAARVAERASSFGQRAAGYSSGVAEAGVTRLAGFKAAPEGLNDMASAAGTASARTSSAFMRMGEAVTLARGRIRLAAAEAKADIVALEGKQASRSGALFGGLLGLYAAKKVFQPAADYQLALERLGNTAKVHDADLQKAGRQILAIGQAYGVGGTHAVDGAHAYISAGLGLKAALAAMPATFKFSMTTGLEADDTARAGIAVMHNLGVSAGEVERAFDAMVEAQKHGKIQAKDMAATFPTLTASAQRLGITGVKGVASLAAAMEEVRFGTNDAGSAATNLNQLLQKLGSPTMSKSMLKIGVNLPSIWAEAQRTGGSYFDMVLDRLAKVKGIADNPFLLGKGVGRDQARNALTSLLRNREEFARNRAEIGAAAGVLDADWTRVSKDAAVKTKQLGAAMQGLAIRLGSTLLPAEEAAAGGLSKIGNALSGFVDRHPRVVGAALGIVGGFAGLRLASIGLAWATGALNVQLLAAKTEILTLGGGMIGVATRAFTALRTTIASAQLLGAVGGIRAVGAAVLTSLVPSFSLGAVAAGALDLALSPIGLAVGAVALAVGAAAFGFQKLRNIGAFFGPFGRSFMKALGPMAPMLRPVVGAMGAMAGWVGKLFSPIAVATWARWGDVAGTAVGNVARIVLRLVDGMAKVAGWLGKLAGHTIELQEGGPLAAPSRVPAPARAPKLAGMRAGGGPTRAGGLYLVGEKGPELWSKGSAGRVLPAAASAAVLAMASGGVPGAAAAAPRHMTVNLTVNGAYDPHATAREVRRVLEDMTRQQDARLTD